MRCEGRLPLAKGKRQRSEGRVELLNFRDSRMRKLKRKSARILLIADTHLGFDLPLHPRIKRRRRGPDFFANFEMALERAQRHEVEIVVHAGDLFYRSRVPTALVQMAMAPLVRVAKADVPVLIVPGNHERSHIPQHLWALHPDIHIFDRPRTYVFDINGLKVAFGGFPFARKVRDEFASLVARTGCQLADADVRVLCMHQTVEGAQVGTVDYTFRSGPDVIRGGTFPEASPLSSLDTSTATKYCGKIYKAGSWPLRLSIPVRLSAHHLPSAKRRNTTRLWKWRRRIVKVGFWKASISCRFRRVRW